MWKNCQLGFSTAWLVCSEEKRGVDVKLGFGLCKSAGLKKRNSLSFPFPCPGRGKTEKVKKGLAFW